MTGPAEVACSMKSRDCWGDIGAYSFNIDLPKVTLCQAHVWSLFQDADATPRRVTVHFRGGPWDGQRVEVDRVVGPVFSVGHELGNHYWLDTKSDPPTYQWSPDA